MLGVEVAVGKFPEIVSVRTKMVVDQVENHSQTQRVSAIDESAEIVWRAVMMEWSE